MAAEMPAAVSSSLIVTAVTPLPPLSLGFKLLLVATKVLQVAGFMSSAFLIQAPAVINM